MILVSGGAISVLLALLLWSQGVTQRRAIDLGRRMSARFGESEARFRVLNEMLPALVLLAGAEDGRIIHANQAARTQLGRVAGMRLSELFADGALGAQAMAEVARDGKWDSREAVVLNGAVIGRNCLVGANALVTEGKIFPDNSLIVGSPARVMRALDDAAVAALTRSADTYVRNWQRYARHLVRLD